MPIISGGGGGGGPAPDIAAVLAVGDDAAGAGIDNVGDSTMQGGSWIFNGDNEEYPRGTGSEAGQTGGPAASVYFGAPGSGGNAGADVDVRAGSGQTGTLAGGRATIAGGDSADANNGASFIAGAGTTAAAGEAAIASGGTTGVAGQAFVSKGGTAVWGGVVAAAGVPAGAPTGKLPIAIDTTAVTGGLYLWTGAAWVKGSTIP